MIEFFTNKRRSWPIIIPIFFLFACIIMSLWKAYNSNEGISFLVALEVFNSNSFSTFGAMLVVDLYQFFAADTGKEEELSGLSKVNIPITVILTVLFGILAVVNTCINNTVTLITQAVYSVIFIISFFRIMRRKTN